MIDFLSNKFLTEEEENEDYIHTTLNFKFTGKYKLTKQKIIVEPLYYLDWKRKEVKECLAKEVSIFIANWSICYWKRMNGFPGFDCTEYEFVEKQVP